MVIASHSFVKRRFFFGGGGGVIGLVVLSVHRSYKLFQAFLRPQTQASSLFLPPNSIGAVLAVFSPKLESKSNVHAT